jgi:hypothetical protein
MVGMQSATLHSTSALLLSHSVRAPHYSNSCTLMQQLLSIRIVACDVRARVKVWIAAVHLVCAIDLRLTH